MVFCKKERLKGEFEPFRERDEGGLFHLGAVIENECAVKEENVLSFLEDIVFAEHHA